MSVRQSGESSMTELKVGDTAPDFETVDDKGDEVRLSDFRGASGALLLP
jgi:peroxiredoxin